MTPEELGKALSEARIARGLTLHDIERDTRISRKYLQALEEGQLDVLPAPVYARAFMRTYAQYLGMNAATLVQHLPGAKPEAELPPLPRIGRDATAPAVSASWLITGVVVLLLFGLGLLLFWDRGGDEPATATQTQDDSLGSDQPTPPIDQPILVEPGIVPDLRSRPLETAVAALEEAELQYLVIEIESDEAPAGTVFDQTPEPGTAAGETTVVTLVVSR